MTSSIAKRRHHAAEVLRTLQIAAPVIIGQVAVFSMNFVDTVMAGRLPERELALSGLGTGGALWSAMLLLTLGTLMAIQPTVAQLHGAGRCAEAGRQTRQAAYVALALMIPYLVVTQSSDAILGWIRVDTRIVPVASAYLGALTWGVPAVCGLFLLRYFSEGTGHTRVTMIYGVTGALLNIPLNYVLMYGKLGFPAMGTVGCGYATSIVLWVQFLMILAYVLRHRHFREFGLFDALEPPRWADIRELLKLGIPIAIAVAVEGTMFLGAALLIARLGPLQAASHMIVSNFCGLVFMVPLALGSSLTIRVGNAIGRGDFAAARYAGVVGLLMVLGFETLSALIMILFPEWIALLYTDDAEVAALAVSLLAYAAVLQFPDGLQICAASALRGMKDTRVPMVFSVLSFWLVGLPVGYTLTFARDMGPSGMWIGLITGLTLGAVLMARRYLQASHRMVQEGAAGR
jgi:MATE family multidrug resistance protein